MKPIALMHVLAVTVGLTLAQISEAANCDGVILSGKYRVVDLNSPENPDMPIAGEKMGADLYDLYHLHDNGTRDLKWSAQLLVGDGNSCLVILKRVDPPEVQVFEITGKSPKGNLILGDTGPDGQNSDGTLIPSYVFQRRN